MKEKAKGKQKFCGNCGYHNVYHYPDQVLCWMRFSQGNDFIVKTLWHCEKWDASNQECYCVEEAKKNNDNR